MRDLVRLRNLVRELHAQLARVRGREPNLPAVVVQDIRAQLAMTRRLIQQQERLNAELAAMLPTMKEVLRLEIEILRQRASGKDVAPPLKRALRQVGAKLGIDLDAALAELHSTQKRRHAE